MRVNIQRGNANGDKRASRAWLPSVLPAALIRENVVERDLGKLTKEKSKDKDKSKSARIEEIIDELNRMIGLTEVKALIHELRAFVEVRNLRSKEGLSNDAMTLHMIFRGNPGTGKTTVARLVGQLYKELGVLPKGHLIEVERADLVGEYIGHTAIKAREQVKKALGGVLFIDEAYSLARGGEKDFGKECIDCLVKAMEDQRANLILILAGYKDEMDLFLRSNPGVRSRFPIHLNFPDYTPAELLEIAEKMLYDRQYCFSSEAKLELRNFLISNQEAGHPYRGNARMVRNIVERAIRRHAVRIMGAMTVSVNRECLMTLEQADLIESCREASMQQRHL
ncbi:AAA family ATPase [Heliophilum fasciatum]|uniref:AAA family ATPase n=1 Tax=Heliophilum fasciatum TaxID=35700 RepID=UPI0038739C38